MQPIAIPSATATATAKTSRGSSSTCASTPGGSLASSVTKSLVSSSLHHSHSHSHPHSHPHSHRASMLSKSLPRRKRGVSESAGTSRASVIDGPAAFWFSLRGYEDGKPYSRYQRTTLDRWELQAADTLTLHFHPAHSRLRPIRIHQNPHSNHLGGYLWTCGVIMCFLVEDVLRVENAFVVELGSGVTCLPSIAWRSAGLARRVIATDIPELLPAMQENLWENHRLTRAKLPSSKENAAPAVPASNTFVLDPRKSQDSMKSDSLNADAKAQEPLGSEEAPWMLEEEEEELTSSHVAVADCNASTMSGTNESILTTAEEDSVSSSTIMSPGAESTEKLCVIEPLALKWQAGMRVQNLPKALQPAASPAESTPDNDIDVITMCDCIYSEASARALVDTLVALCRRNRHHLPQIHCLSEVRNQAAQDAFVKAAQEAQFQVRLWNHTEWHPRVPKECRLDYVNLYTLEYRPQDVNPGRI